MRSHLKIAQLPTGSRGPFNHHSPRPKMRPAKPKPKVISKSKKKPSGNLVKLFNAWARSGKPPPRYNAKTMEERRLGILINKRSGKIKAFALLEKDLQSIPRIRMDYLGREYLRELKGKNGNLTYPEFKALAELQIRYEKQKLHDLWITLTGEAPQRKNCSGPFEYRLAGGLAIERCRQKKNRKSLI